MIGRVSATYAFRSLARHARRTLLSIIGVGVGCAIALIAASWVGGTTDMQIRAVSESGAGHLCIVPAGWVEQREDTLRLTDWEATLETVRHMPGVKSVAPRARTKGLLAFGNRTVGVETVGVDPPAERAANRLVYKSELEGRYLEPRDEGKVVIGRAIAVRLDVELDDDLFVTLAGKDGIHSLMLGVVGILDTGSRDLDMTVCHVNLPEIARATGLAGAAEIAILLEDYRLIPSMQQTLALKLPEGDEVITWKKSNPGIAANVDGDRSFTRGLMGIIMIVVSLGIASAQLTAVLERRKEFAVLSALGMRGRSVVSVIFLEALIVGAGGALIALLLGGSVAYFLHSHGADFSALMGDVSVSNVLLDPVIFGTFGPWLAIRALEISLVSTAIASLYPAWLAARIAPADSLRAG